MFEQPEFFHFEKLRRMEDAFDSWRAIRRVTVVAPHSDDEQAMAAWLTLLVRMNIRSTVLLLFPGFRCPGWNESLTDAEKTRVRVDEGRRACAITGAEFEFVDLSVYWRREDYLFSDEDISELTQVLRRTHPQVVFVPPRFDQHIAHQAARNLTTQALERSGLPPVAVVTYETPWSLLSGSTPPTHVFAYGAELAETKAQAIRQFESQLRVTDYEAWSRLHSAARLITARELLNSHHDLPASLPDAVGVEAFRIESTSPLIGREPEDLVVRYLSSSSSRRELMPAFS